MESVLDKQVTLQLNAAWQPIGWRTVRQALIAMNGGNAGHEPPALAVDMATMRPVEWSEWITLPVRESDLQIMTGKGPIRAPTVLIAVNYKKMPMRTTRLSTGNILERDGLIDQYTGEKLHRKDANVDHVVPRSKGGKDTWENMVTTHRRRNFEKGNKMNHEAGLKLIRKPKAPPTVPASYLIKHAKHDDHHAFIHTQAS